ncbi:MAG: ATP-binding protein [Anaerolineaceae bacterium]|nr:ATP-binding protein [Anaerolineaceae bacterium]
MAVIYPFTAIVGQERMKRALILNAVYPRIGGVLIRGERGTAKSTAARALAALLPPVKVISECKFHCDPKRPESWCTECKEKYTEGDFHQHEIATPFVNLPVSATEDRVVGTLDIEKAIQKGERNFEPGVLAAANRGLLYIDEVNLLDDHVVDVLLDAAAMGVNNVEREGISFSHPARFILVGTMNPEEGDLRPQLLDRFALSVDIHGLLDARERVAIMERNIAFEKDPEAFHRFWESEEKKLSDQIEKAQEIVDQVSYSSRDLLTIATLTSQMNVDGHRPDLVILKAARAQAAFEGRYSVKPLDIALAAELALAHRMRRNPFDNAKLDVEKLQVQIDALQGAYTESNEESMQAEPSADGEKKK